MSELDVIGMLEQMAAYGHAPRDGCHLFGVGYEDAFERLRKKYIISRFDRGHSGEKFVVGPFGSGKTHFLREIFEIAREHDCVTSEVTLNKDLDFTESLVTYKEVARELRAPGRDDHGMRSLLMAAIERVGSLASDPEAAEHLVRSWAGGLDKADFKLESFGRIAKKGVLSYLSEDEAGFESACRWLGGDIADKALARELSESPVPQDEHKLHGRRALLSLFQFVKHAKFRGTVVGFDEAEQGFAVDRARVNRIHSMLQSGINATVDLQGGSALVLYALTPDIVEKMEEFAALQQRVADPRPGHGFFAGDTMAPLISLTERGDVVEELKTIGRRLVDLLYENTDEPPSAKPDDVKKIVDSVAENVAATDIRSSNRRTMVKRVCSMLLTLHEEGLLEDPGVQPEIVEQKGEDEV